MRRNQKLLAGTLVLAGTALAIDAGMLVYRSLCRQHYAENVILLEKPRAESFWTLTETTGGHLIRVRDGRFKGWYLAHDDLVNSIENTIGFVSIGVRLKVGTYVRNLVLREKPGPDCYWNIKETDRGSHIQATDGRYKSWYLDFIAEYVPDTGTNPRTAWNLALNEKPVAGTRWKLTRTARGTLIAATANPFEGWCLDALQEAKVLERNPCRGEETTKDRQTPPLAK